MLRYRRWKFRMKEGGAKTQETNHAIVCWSLVGLFLYTYNHVPGLSWVFSSSSIFLSLGVMSRDGGLTLFGEWAGFFFLECWFHVATTARE